MTWRTAYFSLAHARQEAAELLAHLQRTGGGRRHRRGARGNRNQVGRGSDATPPERSQGFRVRLSAMQTNDCVARPYPPHHRRCAVHARLAVFQAAVERRYLNPDKMNRTAKRACLLVDADTPPHAAMKSSDKKQYHK